MKNRLTETIQRALKKRTKLFCVFLTLGYPSLRETEELLFEMDQMGVDIIELGIPFSDPMADGPTIQFSSEQALKKGVSIHDAFELVSRLRRRGCKVPVICFSYLNPIYHFGLEEFAKKAKVSGFDGLIIPDLPPEEERQFSRSCRQHQLSQVFLIAPTTRTSRAAMIDQSSSGFVYYVSLKGVTGSAKADPLQVGKEVKQVCRPVKNPVLIGFGISSEAQAKSMASSSDGVIVGSAIIETIRTHGGSTDSAIQFVKKLLSAVKGPRNAVSARS